MTGGSDDDNKYAIDVKSGETSESTYRPIKPEDLDGSNGNIHVKSGGTSIFPSWSISALRSMSASRSRSIEWAIESGILDPANHLERLRLARETGVDWQLILRQQIEVVKLKYLGPLNEMYKKVLLKIDSSSGEQLNSEQLDKLKVCKSMLERVIEFIDNPKDDFSFADQHTFGKYANSMRAFVTYNIQLEPLSWYIIQDWLELGEHHVLRRQLNRSNNFTVGSHTLEQANFNPLRLKQEDAGAKKYSEIEVMAQEFQMPLQTSKVDKIQSLQENLGEKKTLLEERVQSLEEKNQELQMQLQNQTSKVDGIEAHVENLGEKNRRLEEKVRSLEEYIQEMPRGARKRVKNKSAECSIDL